MQLRGKISAVERVVFQLRFAFHEFFHGLNVNMNIGPEIPRVIFSAAAGLYYPLDSPFRSLSPSLRGYIGV